MSRSALVASLLFLLGILVLGAAGLLLGGQARSDEPVSKAAEIAGAPTNASPRIPIPAYTATPPTRERASPTPVPLSVTVHEGELSRVYVTGAMTVGELLAEKNIFLGDNDHVQPGQEDALADQMHITIRRALPLTIEVDGQILALFSAAPTVGEALDYAGIVLGELDQVDPPPDAAIQSGNRIHVLRVREETIIEDEVVPYQTVYQPTDTLDLDIKAVLSPGAPGIKRRSTRVRYENGVEVSRQVEGEWIEQEPQNEVVGYGTRIVTNIIDTPEGPREYWRVLRMRATAYTAASSGKSPDHPSYGITASGLPAGTGIVAVDPNVIPFRSEVYVPGYGVGFAGDTGGGVKGRWIDLGYDEDELQAWNGYVDVYYLTPVPEEIDYLLPEVLP